MITSHQLPVTNYKSPVTSNQLQVTSHQLQVTSYKLLQFPFIDFKFYIVIGGLLDGEVRKNH